MYVLNKVMDMMSYAIISKKFIQEETEIERSLQFEDYHLLCHVENVLESLVLMDRGKLHLSIWLVYC